MVFRARHCGACVTQGRGEMHGLCAPLLSNIRGMGGGMWFLSYYHGTNLQPIKRLG